MGLKELYRLEQYVSNLFIVNKQGDGQNKYKI